MPFTPALRPVFGSARQHAEPAVPIPHRRGRDDARRAAEAGTAKALVAELPAAGESLHCLMTGRYDLTQVIAAVCGARPCGHLRIATLSYGPKNAAQLLALLAAKKAARLTLVCSVFFVEKNRKMHEWLLAELAAHPGSALVGARNHCKVALFDYPPADALVFEGSANLRSNSNREQLAVVRDRRLHDWHAAWIDRMAAPHAPVV